MNLDTLRQREVARPDEHSPTRFGPFVVNVSPEEWDALLDVAEAAQQFISSTSYFRQRKESRAQFEEFALALARLDRLVTHKED